MQSSSDLGSRLCAHKSLVCGKFDSLKAEVSENPVLQEIFNICVLTEKDRIVQFREDDWLRQLHDGPVDGAEFFCYPRDLIFRDAALSKNSQCNIEIRELPGIA